MTTPYKILASLGAAAAFAVGMFMLGVEYQKGQGAIDESAAIKTNIKDHNDGQKELAKTIEYVEKIEYVYKDKIIHIPAPDLTKPCPIDELTRVRRDVFGAFPKELFQSTDEVPGMDN